MKICIAAAGMDGEGTLTREAAEAIGQAELLIGASRMLRPYAESGKTLFTSWDPAEIAARLRSGTEETAAVLMSGDTGFYSGTKRLLPMLEGMDVTVLPGISSPVYLCARTGLSWEKMHFVSLHGIGGSIAAQVRCHPYCCFLLGGEITAALLCRRLCDCGLTETTVYIGENLGSPVECITKGKPESFLDRPEEKLCTVIVENPGWCSYLPCGIPDGEFERSAIPMTKAEVRCMAVASLCVGRNEICWDIGCGTGSVTVELALRCPDGAVYAVDRHPEAVRLTRANALHFACDNVTVQEGVFPEIALPCPDKVFIGGTGGRLPEILSTVYALNPAAWVTLTAVTLETLSEAQTALAVCGKACSITQIGVTRTRRLGSHTMLQAENPIWLICAPGV